MATTQRSLIVGIFTDSVQADLAIDQLQQEGFNSDLLSLTHQQGGRAGGVKNLFSKHSEQQGSIVDELKSLGIAEEEARSYQNELDAGRVIITVQADGRQQEAREILESNGAYDIHTHPETKNPS